MKPIVPVLVASVFAVGCTAPPDATLSEARSDAIEDSVATFLSTWSEGVGAADWDRLIERYADDPEFTWVEDGQVRYRSRAALRSAFDGLQGQFSGARTEFVDPSITPLAPGPKPALEIGPPILHVWLPGDRIGVTIAGGCR